MLTRFRLTRRRWNTVLIAAIALFMMLMAAPDLIKQYLIQAEPVSSQGFVLNPDADPIEINYAGIQFYLVDGVWQAIPQKWNHEAHNVVARWIAIQGTPIDTETYQKLKPGFRDPMTIEVWYQQLEEPQRITAYPFDQFWLLSTYDEHWVAVSFEGSSLLPTHSNN